MNKLMKPQQLTYQEKFDYLRLIRSENIGSITFFKLTEHFGSASEALKNVKSMAKKGGKKSFKLASLKDIEKEFIKAEKENIHIIAFPEAEYPPLLRQIHDPPPILYGKGNMQLLRKKSFAIVGARNASANGRILSQKFASELGENNICVVSGMARGIDTKAHEGALSSGTIAILGGGVDIIYPKENAELYQRITQAGAVISEAPIGMHPIAKHFPRRNRIISGMCRGILVVEAARSSGSLITANMAIEQGRDVFAVPGSPIDERARGPNKLIKQGAILTEDIFDILPIINQIDYQAKTSSEIYLMPSQKPPSFDEKELENLRKEVMVLLNPTPIEIDILIRELNCSHSFLAHILLELDLAGKLSRHPGNKVSLEKF